jgi:hypothetical protein
VTNRALAFVVFLPIAAVIGFVAGRATAPIGTVLEATGPDGASRLRVDRRLSMGAADQRVVLVSAGEETELKRLDESTGDATELVWAPNGELAGVLVNHMKLVVIDVAGKRVLYEQPLVEKLDGSHMARGVSFSANAMAITFDECPTFGAGCRPRFLALPTRQ